MNARYMTEDEIASVTNELPEPSIPGDDPHDTSQWYAWRDAVNERIATALRAIGCRVVMSGGDRTTAEAHVTVDAGSKRKPTTRTFKIFTYF